MADKKPEQTFSFETMAVVLYAMLQSGVTLGTEHYNLMSAVDSKRTAVAFQHQFRKVKARAKELQSQAKEGGVGSPVASTKKRAGSTSARTTPNSTKSKARKARSELASTSDDEQAEGDDDDKSVSKKLKVKAEQEDDDEEYL